MRSTLIQEEWRPVVGYAGLYDASNFGRIRSLKFGKIKILKQVKHTDGYLQVNLYKNGKMKHLTVHRLVYEAFNGKITEGKQVNHINEIKTDNSLWNLNLMSPKENINWGNHNKKIKEKLSDPVLQLTLDDVLVKEWPSIMEAVRNGFIHTCISKCCNGKLKTHKGFKWRKKESVL